MKPQVRKSRRIRLVNPRVIDRERNARRKSATKRTEAYRHPVREALGKAIEEAHKHSAKPDRRAVMDILNEHKRLKIEDAKQRASLRRRDFLATIIEPIVQRNPMITVNELVEQLRSAARARPTELEVTRDTISWAAPGRAMKDTPISGLKDRLHRVKARLSR